MKILKIMIVFTIIVVITNCDIFNNPVDPMAKNYIGDPVTEETTEKFSVGSIGPAGGYVFYDDEVDGVDDIPGFRYLEAAPVDIAETKQWGTYNHTVSGADGTVIGTGAQNTLDIISGDSSTTNAAHACANYIIENNGITYYDWFLPSRDELDAMYDILKVNGLVEFVDNWYWSSSEFNDDEAWRQSFDLGYQGSNGKRNYRIVRPVRAFNNSDLEQITVSFQKDDDTTGDVPNSIIRGSFYEVIIPSEGSLVKDSHVFQSWNTKADGTGIVYYPGDTLTLGTTDIILYAIFLESLLGDIGPAGGYVFYDDEVDGVDDIPGFRYLEAAPVDIAETKHWGTYSPEVNYVPGTAIIHVVSGADGTVIGTGAQNTLDIISGDISITNAAHACANYTVENNGTTYYDWFLPSIDELDAMYENLMVNDSSGFDHNSYWSSSEFNGRTAYRLYLNDGNSYYLSKDVSIGVRPVRAF